MSKFCIYDLNDLRKKLSEYGYSAMEIERICDSEQSYFTEPEFKEACEYYRDTKKEGE